MAPFHQAKSCQKVACWEGSFQRVQVIEGPRKPGMVLLGEKESFSTPAQAKYLDVFFWLWSGQDRKFLLG